MSTIAMPAETHAAAPNRVLSIDVLRGITIAFMILVNDPGDWAHTYAQLDHAKWNGFTLTDLVFPNFLFLVGASIILSLSTRIARSRSGTLDNATRRTLALRILRRSATILFIDLFLTAAPYFHLTRLRIYGVLTRIAICYLVVGLLCLFTQRARTLLITAAAILLGYWALMRFVPVPGFGVPTHAMPILDPDRNLAAWLDRAINAALQNTIHTGRLYEHTRDPEGLLSTLPAIATTIFGAVTALWLRRPDPTSTTQNLSSRPEPATQSLSSRPERSPGSPASVLPRWGGSVVKGPASLLPQSSQLQTPTPDHLHSPSLKTQHETLRGLLLASFACLLARPPLEPHLPHQQKSLDQLLRPLRRRLLPPRPRSLLLARRCPPPPASVACAAEPSSGPGSSSAQTPSPPTPSPSSALRPWLLIKIHDSWNPDPTKTISAWGWIYRHLFSRGVSTDNTSLAFGLAFVALCFLPNLFLWRKRIFLKV